MDIAPVCYTVVCKAKIVSLQKKPSIMGPSPMLPTQKPAKADGKEDAMSKDAPGMRGYRPRNKSDGELRQKRSDTHMGTIEKTYGVDLNVRSDMELGTFLKKNDIASLNDLITGK